MIAPRKIDMFGRWTVTLLGVGFTVLVSQQIVRPFLDARRNLGALREAVQVLSSTEGDVDLLSAEINLVSQAIVASEAELPPVPNLDAFLEQVGEIGRQTRVRIERLAPREITEQRLFRELKVEVRVTGAFPAVHDFLARLERSGPLARVEQVRVVGGTDRCAADMELALYFAPVEGG